MTIRTLGADARSNPAGAPAHACAHARAHSHAPTFHGPRRTGRHRLGARPARAAGAFGVLVLLAALSLAATPAAARSAAAESRGGAREAPVALVTGSASGIGLALVRELAARDWQVIATARDPGAAAELNALARERPNVRVERLDVTDAAERRALAERLRGQPIDLLVNNAGVAGDYAAQRLGSLDREVFDRVMHVNAWGPLAVSEAFLEHVAASRQKKIVTISSITASLARAEDASGNYFYRMSKTAVNMAMRVLQAETRERGIVVALLHPGGVDTDLFREYAGSPAARASLQPAEAARRLLRVVDQLEPGRGGRFWDNDGSEIPW